LWFKKLFDKWNTKRILKSKKTSLYKADRKLCEELLMKLDISNFSKYTPNIGLSIYINTRYNTIEDYTNKIKQINLYLKQGVIINPTHDNGNEILISLDRFLISSDGFYLDVKKALLDFKNNALELCKLMEESDIAEYGIHENNLRMLTKIIINIREVTSILISI
jgi:hypothetical protein